MRRRWRVRVGSRFVCRAAPLEHGITRGSRDEERPVVEERQVAPMPFAVGSPVMRHSVMTPWSIFLLVDGTFVDDLVIGAVQETDFDLLRLLL